MHNPLYILNFHGLGEMPAWVPEGEAPYWVSPDFFCRILDLVRGRADVQISFDDGNRTDLTLALPALKLRRMTAQFFVVADRIGRPGYLSGADIQELVAAGMTIGNHGLQHHRWSGLDARTLRRELTSAQEQLTQVSGTEVRDAACPFGSYNRRVLKVLRDCNFGRVYTSDCGPAFGDHWLQARNTITRDASLPGVQGIITQPPTGAKRLWRELKLLIKRWR